jgi:hypothetical protein
MNTIKSGDGNPDIYERIKAVKLREATISVANRIKELIEPNIKDNLDTETHRDVVLTYCIKMRKGNEPFYVKALFTEKGTLRIPDLVYEMKAETFLNTIDSYMRKISSGDYGDIVSQDDMNDTIYRIMKQCDSEYIAV